MVTLAVIGLGSRGKGYLIEARLFARKEIKAVAALEVNACKLKEIQKSFKLDKDKCFEDEDAFFKAGKLADCLLIATGDREHYRQCKRGLEAGYNILLEKPVSPKLDEVRELARLADEKGLKIVVCHVLRYAKFYLSLKKVLDSGILGKIVQITHSENIAYYHFAHSYVRGNWHKESDSAPSLLAKCCHDLDLLIWFLGEKPCSVSSQGSLEYFKKENMPKDAAERCVDCKHRACPYNAVNLYIKDPFYKAKFVKYMRRVIAGRTGVSNKEMAELLKTSDYGRCVFASDNDVMDNQTLLLTFPSGATVTHTMSAFSNDMNRTTRFYCEKGEIIANDLKGRYTVTVFGKRPKKYRAKLIPITGHIEGDIGTIVNFARLMNGSLSKQIDVTYIDDAVASHEACFYADMSRKQNGVKVDIPR